MNGAQLAGWLRYLADQVEAADRVTGLPFKAGPVPIQVPNSSSLRTWKQRHGTLDPPSVSNPSHGVIRQTIRDAFETQTETLLRRIRDAVETAVVGSGAPTVSLRSKALEVVGNTARLSRAGATTPTAATGETESASDDELFGTPVREHGERPRERRDLLYRKYQAHEWEPSAEHHAYAVELGLSEEDYRQALLECRDKHGLRPHDLPWWDDRFCRFVEQRALKSGPRKASGEFDQDDEGMAARSEAVFAHLEAELS